MLFIYTGFILPIPKMQTWFWWFGYVDPVGYAFESLMINEFSSRQFPCSSYIPQGPGYLKVHSHQKMCVAIGAEPAVFSVDGKKYLVSIFRYYSEHLWRNLGVLFAIISFLCGLYLLATEYNFGSKIKG